MPGYPQTAQRSMSRATLVLLTLLGMLALAAPGPLRAETLSPPTVGYSADMVIASAGVRQMVRIFRDGEKSRLTMTGPQGLQVVIRRIDKNVGYMLIPAKRIAIRMPLAGMGRSLSQLAEKDTVATVVGRERVNGVETTKYRIRSPNPDGGVTTGFAWLTRENIVMRFIGTSEKNGRRISVRIELANLRVGPQDPAEFEIPPGFRIMSPGGQGMPAN